MMSVVAGAETLERNDDGVGIENNGGLQVDVGQEGNHKLLVWKDLYAAILVLGGMRENSHYMGKRA